MSKGTTYYSLPSFLPFCLLLHCSKKDYSMKYLLKRQKNQRDMLQKGILKRKRYSLCLCVFRTVVTVFQILHPSLCFIFYTKHVRWILLGPVKISTTCYFSFFFLISVDKLYFSIRLHFTHICNERMRFELGLN